jgi:hypothetical protein
VDGVVLDGEGVRGLEGWWGSRRWTRKVRRVNGVREGGSRHVHLGLM